MALNEGYHDNVAMADYVGDPAPRPSISTGTICDLIQRSPLHAYSGHPRLGGRGSEASARGDLGSAVHSLLLGGNAVVFAPPEFTDWRKKDAQAFRDVAREAGQLPLLERERDGVMEATRHAAQRLNQYGAGKAEQTMIFKIGDIYGRSRADWIDDSGWYDIDVKTCDNADGREWVRKCVLPGGLDVQAGLRSIGHEVLSGKPRTMLWLLVEIEPPYAVSVAGVSPTMLAFARRKVMHAASVWAHCLANNAWPGYSNDVYMADVPAYAEAEFAQRTGVLP